jgi:hypothetical protein
MDVLNASACNWLACSCCWNVTQNRRISVARNLAMTSTIINAHSGRTELPKMATSVTPSSLISGQESAVETTPLLSGPPAQPQTHRQPSVAGDTHQGFHVIPRTTPEAEIPQHSVRAVFATLSVLLIGSSVPQKTLFYANLT